MRCGAVRLLCFVVMGGAGHGCVVFLFMVCCGMVWVACWWSDCRRVGFFVALSSLLLVVVGATLLFFLRRRSDAISFALLAVLLLVLFWTIAWFT